MICPIRILQDPTAQSLKKAVFQAAIGSRSLVKVGTSQRFTKVGGSDNHGVGTQAIIAEPQITAELQTFYFW